MQVIIPVAGKGTRLRPHTHVIPKPLMRVAGKEVLGHILDKLDPKQVSEVILIVGHLEEKIDEYVKAFYPQLNVRYVKQDELKGTAHAIKLVEPFVVEDILIIFSDTLFDADFAKIPQLRQDFAGLMWVKEVEDYQRFGVVLANDEGVMTKIVEKPTEPISKLANIGLYYIQDWKLMFQGIDKVLAEEPHEKGEYFLTDAFQFMVEKGAKIKPIEVHQWLDCGKIETLLETNHELLKNGHSIMPEAKNGVTIHEPVHIGKDVFLENVELGPNVTIEAGSSVKNSKIVHSIVGRSSIIENSELDASLIGSEAVVKNIKGTLNILDHSEVIGS